MESSSTQGASVPPGRIPGRGGRRRGRGGRSNRGVGESTPSAMGEKPSGRGRGRGTGKKATSSDTTVGHSRQKSNHNSIDHDDSGATDEDVMIEFMYFLRSGDEEARNIHAEFSGKRKHFVQAVREFLSRHKNNSNGNANMIHHSNNHDQPTEWSNLGGPTQTSIQQGNSSISINSYSTSVIQQQEQAIQHGDLYPYLSTPPTTFKPFHHITEHNQIRSVDDLFKLCRYDNQKIAESDSFTMHIDGGEGDPDLIRMVDTLTMQGLDDDEHDRVLEITSIPSPMVQTTTITSSNNIPSIETPINFNEHSESQLILKTPTHEVEEKTPTTVKEEEKPSLITAATPNPKWQPRRLTMRIHEQPGQLLANSIPTTEDGFPHLILGPRKKVIATWKLPLSFLRQYSLKKLQEKYGKDGGGVIDVTKLTLQDAIQTLTVGLFRRGCAENGQSFSIISKAVLVSENSEMSEVEKSEFHVDIDAKSDLIWGTVPFFTPRTPGNVVLRLYFDDHTVDTLATSQCIRVAISEHDLESTLRFILSNFKTNKGSNLSPLYSLVAVIEQFCPNSGYPSTRSRGFSTTTPGTESIFESAGRAAFGCLCEARRAFESSRYEYKKRKTHSQSIAQEKVKDVPRDDDSANDEDCPIEDEVDSPSKDVRKSDAIRSRKWLEMQAAFASVLKALLSNPALSLLLKRDTIQKIRLEHELWCGFCESFAENPWIDENEFDNVADSKGIFRCPHPVKEEHFILCRRNVAEMQTHVLGFIPSRITLKKRNKSAFEELSSSLKDWYFKEYAMNTDAKKKREFARLRIEEIVSNCSAFPKGTKVVVFGSSANGFGSKNSDIDMCIQMPPETELIDGKDTNGSAAMAKVAKLLEESGIEDVDVTRLTARIPLIMFKFGFDSGSGEKEYLECDLSMQNPLACVNTSLLLSYSHLHPDIRVLAAVIKLWAKNRDINSPSKQTLSSYGYILMLLYFLTTHEISDDGIISPLFNGNDRIIKGKPIIPNLQWVDPACILKPGPYYQELNNKPSTQNFAMSHPMEPTVSINTYFFEINNESTKKKVQDLFRPVLKESLALILAAFFRFYAYEFDFKKHVVSLNSTVKKGPVERESKCESDGWKVFGETLFIEDPFECFYDVAHVLKASTFRTIRKEFALAYTKVMEWSKDCSENNRTERSLMNILFEPVSPNKAQKDVTD